MVPRPGWLTVRQMADALGVSQRTIQRRIEAGKFVNREFGGKLILRHPEKP